ncbi:MAG: hypothetical protein ACLQAT_06055 [Candidatus Binataceae bacterium]
MSAPVQVTSHDTTVVVGDVTDGGTTGSVTPDTSFNGFTTYNGSVDIVAANNGTYILTTDEYSDVAIFNFNLSPVATLSATQFWCPPGSANPLPICSQSGPSWADARTVYDTGAGHFVISALFAATVSGPVQDAVAVSQTADPTGQWNLYQFPACGSFDTWDGSDQPHLGFNSQWIGITSACSNSGTTDGAGLAIFDKTSLYNGGSLALNTNWFEFVDPNSGGPYYGLNYIPSSRENPVVTYTSTINNRLYLVASDISSSGNAMVVYSFVDGSTDSPVFYSDTETVTTSFGVLGSRGPQILPASDAPGCQSCIESDANGWIQSAGVWLFSSVGEPFIVSTMAMGAPGHARASKLINVATNTATGSATALQIAPSADGQGYLASEITQPAVPTGDNFVIPYDYTGPDFYPGLRIAYWNADSNTLVYTIPQEGSLTPSKKNGCVDQGRWVDFIDAITPIPNSTEVVLGGTLAYPSPNDPTCATYFAIYSP